MRSLESIRRAAPSLAFVLLALSGVLRMWPPRSLARYARVWIWSHRLLLVAALLQSDFERYGKLTTTLKLTID